MKKNIDQEDLDPSQFIQNLDAGINNRSEFQSHISINSKRNRSKDLQIKMEEINEKLYDACEKGEKDIVSKLLKDQIDLKRQSNGSTYTELFGEDLQEFVGFISMDFKGLNDSTRKVGIVKLLLDSKANPYLCNVVFQQQ